MATSSGLGGESGMAAVEFALVAPLLLVLAFATVAYGIYFAVWIAVTEAAAVGARASVAGLTDVERQTIATQEVASFFASYGPMLDATAYKLTCEKPSNGVLKVSVTYDMSGFNLAMIGGLLPVPSTKPTASVTVSNGGL